MVAGLGWEENYAAHGLVRVWRREIFHGDAAGREFFDGETRASFRRTRAHEDGLREWGKSSRTKPLEGWNQSWPEAGIGPLLSGRVTRSFSFIFHVGVKNKVLQSRALSPEDRATCARKFPRGIFSRTVLASSGRPKVSRYLI